MFMRSMAAGRAAQQQPQQRPAAITERRAPLCLCNASQHTPCAAHRMTLVWFGAMTSSRVLTRSERPSSVVTLMSVPHSASASERRWCSTKSSPSRLKRACGFSSITNTMSAARRPGRSSPARCQGRAARDKQVRRAEAFSAAPSFVLHLCCCGCLYSNNPCARRGSSANRQQRRARQRTQRGGASSSSAAALTLFLERDLGALFPARLNRHLQNLLLAAQRTPRCVPHRARDLAAAV